MEKHYLLGEAAKILRRKPHQMVHLLTTGKIPEPEQRISNKRLFTANDVVTLARYFRVSPDWSTVEQITAGSDTKAAKGLKLRSPFEVISLGGTDHEVRDGDGQVFAWANDRAKALVMAGLLEAASRS